MKVVIMAGGSGTRIRDLFPDVPKPLIKIQGVPVLERQIVCLKKQGFTEFIITVSYMADKIIDYFGNGESLGVSIDYYVERTPLGNAGALYMIRDKLDDDFLLINADSLFDIDFNRFVSYHKRTSGLATILTHPNNHPFDSGLIVADDNHKVKKWLSKEDIRPLWYKNRVNAGIHILNSKVINSILLSDLVEKYNNGEKLDLDRDILKKLVSIGQLYCYDSPEYVKDMGVPERYLQVNTDWVKGIIEKKNLMNKQKAIFIDRDGTINVYKGFLKNIDDFELLDGVAEAIKKINRSEYLAIVVTNQPVIARGEVTFSQLQMIHNKMETLLGLEGAYLDAIYFCPHHPDKGFANEVPDLKIECDCRKPKPGMLIKAAQDYNIDLSLSWMIGDGKNDVLAGMNAGCKTALIGNKDYQQDLTVGSLKEFVDKILS